MKDNPINIGFDDATFKLKSNSKKTQLIGVICQGVRIVKAVRSEIDIDGDNATSALIELVLKHKNLVQYVLTHTITFGGFNLIDLKKIYDKIKKPVIAITEREVNLD
ncbi:MAG: endonuclease dU, partial [Promethearchaeota archaeon]